MVRGLLLLVTACAALWALSPSGGFTQSNPFERLVGRGSERAAETVWFERADGRGGFVFDRSARPALIFPEGASEVYAVQPARASGGGEVWLTDTDKVMLRFSNLGGATYFPEDAPDGVIAEATGPADAVRPDPVPADDLTDAASQMVNALGRLNRRVVTAELTETGPVDNAVVVDAMRMVVFGAEDASRRAVRDLEIVRIGLGEVPRARYSNGVLDISVNPRMGYGGRPSSDHIRRILERG